MASDSGHTPVLVKEIIDLFKPQTGDILLDATLGHGGHAQAFLEAVGGQGSVVGLEVDPQAIKKAKQTLAQYPEQVTYIHTNFGQMKDSLTGGGILPSTSFSHVLFDLGIGSHQLADPKRGFSFHSEGELTMRYGETDELPPSHLPFLNDLTKYLGSLPDAREIIGNLSHSELAQLIRIYGEEKFAGRIAAAMKSASQVPQTAAKLADLIEQAVPKHYERGRIHPATRTFQALRLAVNRELEVIESALPQAVELLKPGGMVGVISFHSLEDRIVKRFFRREASNCICPPEYPECMCEHKPSLSIITKQPITASEEEQDNNPRARSAKLRAARKK